jgi:hypothetical protein
MSQLEKMQFDEEKFVTLLGKLIGEAKYLQVRSCCMLSAVVKSARYW